MADSWHSVVVLFGLICAVAAFFSSPTEAQLHPNFYQKSCPKVFPIAGSIVRAEIKKDSRIAASLLRMHFHDCFVQGCDGSVLLDGPNTEKTTPPNNNSLRGFGVIDEIKTAVERACPGVVSCADVLALAAFFSIIMSGGPAWPIPLGRRDSLAPAPGLTTNLPAPTFNIARLKTAFKNQNLSATDLVALSGGHTIGLARCIIIEGRLFPGDPVLNKTLLNTLRKLCPQNGNANFAVPMDAVSPVTFDNLYFKGLLSNEGLFSSDQNLTVASDTNALVHKYANDQVEFFSDFATGMRKMGNLNVLTGTRGQIRKKCNVPNPTRRPFVEQIMTEPQTVIEEVSKEVAEIFEGFIKSVVKEIVGDDFERLMEHSDGGSMNMAI